MDFKFIYIFLRIVRIDKCKDYGLENKIDVKKA